MTPSACICSDAGEAGSESGREKCSRPKSFAYKGQSGNMVYLTVPFSHHCKNSEPRVYDNFSFFKSGSESFVCTIKGTDKDEHSKTWPMIVDWSCPPSPIPGGGPGGGRALRTVSGSLHERRERTPYCKYLGKKRQVLAVFGAVLGFMSMGASIGWAATAIPDMRSRFKEVNGNGIKVEEESWIHALMTLGAAFGCPLASYCIERYGRRFTLILTAIPFMGACGTMIFAQNVGMFYFGRLIKGFCVGFYTISTPVFVAEISEKNIRGAFATGQIIMLNMGLLLIYVIGTFASWKIQSVAVGMIPAVGSIILLFVHESPRYWLNKERYDMAVKSLVWYRGAKFPKDVEVELKEILHSVEEEKQRAAHWQTSLCRKSVLKPVLITLGLVVIQQCSGIDAIKGYSVDIFASSGAYFEEHWCTNILGGVNLLTCIIASRLVDQCGRRLLLMYSGAVMTFALGTLGAFFYTKQYFLNCETPAALAWWPIASLVLYSAGFSLGFGPIVWIFMGELLPSSVKGVAIGVVVTSKWLLSFVVTKFFLGYLACLGDHVGYAILAFICLIGVVYVYLCVPETKQKSLDEIQKVFKTKVKKRVYEKCSGTGSV